MLDAIFNQSKSKENIMVCSPRRQGKTTLLVKIANDKVEKGERLGIIAPNMGYLIKELVDTKKVVFGNSMSRLALEQSRPFDCILVEEAALLKDEILKEVIKYPAQKIIVFTPVFCDPSKPPLIKKLWDNLPGIKYKLPPANNVKEEFFSDLDLQTEVKGDWVY